MSLFHTTLDRREGETDNDDPERARLLKIYRAWKAATLARTLTWWSGASSLSTILAGIVTLFAAVLLPLDSLLRGAKPFFADRLPQSGWPIAVSLLAIFLAGALLTARWLWLATRHPHPKRRWLNVLLILIGGIPLLGLLTVPWWRRFQERSHFLPRRGPEIPLPDLARSRPSGLPVRLLGKAKADSWFAMLLLAGQIIILLMVSLWLSREVAAGHLERRYALGLSLLLHISLFLILFSLGLRAGRLGRSLPRHQHRLLVAATFFCLLPIPLSPLAGSLPLMVLEPGMTRSRTLLWQALVRRKEAGRVPLWLDLEESLRSGWGRLPWLQRIWSPPKSVTRQPTLGPAEVRILLFYDLRVFALSFDAACLGWGTSWLAARFPTSAALLQRLSAGVLYSALLFFAAALSVSAIHLILRLFRISGPLSVLDRHPYAVYAAKVSFALAAGLFFGIEIRQGDPQRVGNVLMNLFFILILIKGYSLIVTSLKPKARWRGPWPWNEAFNFSVLFLLMILCGLGGPLELLPGGLAFWFLTWPLWAWLLARWFISPLLRPFSAFDGNLSTSLRAERAILALTAILPFGALAIPWCIYLRDRHRSGAKIERSGVDRKRLGSEGAGGALIKHIWQRNPRRTSREERSPQ